jgi:lysozyme
MTPSSACFALIQKYEGLSLTAYQDIVGVWTIGYGSTNSVKPNMVITEAQAVERLHSDVASAVRCVNSRVTREISQNQFDALVSFTFNLGCAALVSSTLLKLLNVGDISGAAAEFGRWTHAGVRVLPGLVARREAERKLFVL